MPGNNDIDVGYTSQIATRSANIQRHIGSGSGVMTRMYQQYSSGGGGLSAGISGLAAIAGLGGVPLRPTHNGSVVVALNETREREKRELSQLNDKFAQYVEKVRFLEAQNRKLHLELEALQKRSGQGSTKIKEMYEIEMHEAKKLVSETDHERLSAEGKARQAEKDLETYRRKYDSILAARDTDRSSIDRLQQQIAENEGQISLFRRRLADLEDEAKRYKAETQRLALEISRLQSEIQNEMMIKNTLDTEKMTLEDELTLLKQTHEASLIELKPTALVGELDTTRFFKNELAQAIRDIRARFEEDSERKRADLHSRYTMQYNELILKYKKNGLEPMQMEQQRMQEEKIRTSLLTTRNEVAHMKARNEELNNRINELQISIKQEKADGDRLITRRSVEIEELRTRLEKLRREYQEISTLKTSLEKEIFTYRELLEGTNNRDGLKQIVGHIMEEARRIESSRIADGHVSGAIGHASVSSSSSQIAQRTLVSGSASSSQYGSAERLVASPARASASYGGASGGASSSYSYSASSHQEYSS
ncbi:unnamed protein product [Rotaria socialis]|uniref:IF rod domain-containing protein n=1 Tax=Rotaria socialis TaxID=392032 RepID=A0A818ABW8_9BILA|nr:unnamed protein product [Rotaria socialis]CAF4694460.1 unnamed protein product [Rotaria socialis]